MIRKKQKFKLKCHKNKQKEQLPNKETNKKISSFILYRQKDCYVKGLDMDMSTGIKYAGFDPKWSE